MKKTNLHITAFVFAVLTALLFTGCFDPIYNVIRQDVKPEKPTVSGANINSIARITVNNSEKLVLSADNGLRYKDADNDTHGSWSNYSGLPFENIHSTREDSELKGRFINQVVSDEKHLYLVTYNAQAEDPVIYTKDMSNGWSGDWGTVSGITLTMGKFSVFSTNAYKPSDRHAYVRVGSDSYELNGTTATLVDSGSSYRSAVATTNGVKFLKSPVSISNGENNVYYGDGSTLYYSTNGGSSFASAGSAGHTISSLALCSDSILIGCGHPTGETGGIKHAYLNAEGVPGGIT